MSTSASVHDQRFGEEQRSRPASVACVPNPEGPTRRWAAGHVRARTVDGVVDQRVRVGDLISTDDLSRGAADRETRARGAAIPVTVSATRRPHGPTVSSDGASGHTPSSGSDPESFFRPTTPQHAAGLRIEPTVSVPKATSASPVATATADPLDDPPGTQRSRAG